MPKIVTILGTRPEIVKLSPLIPLLNASFEHQIIHTGQHYSFEMDAIFFHELNLPLPDHALDVGSGSHGWQTGQMLIEIERVLLAERPDAAVVLGDTNTTLAGALTASKLHVPVAHVEAGCRSFNRAMPEELNRILVDHAAEWLFAPTAHSRDNLLREGIEPQRIHLEGSTATDACLCNMELAERRTLVRELGLERGAYVVLTIHRAENTLPEALSGIVTAVNELSQRWPFVLPIHPRTRAALGSNAWGPNVRVIDPLGYLDMLHLVSNARAVMTDSGGLQEETAVIGVPLLIVRQETEWTYLIEAGAGVLVGNTFESITARAAPLLESGAAGFGKVDIAAQQGAARRIVERLYDCMLRG